MVCENMNLRNQLLQGHVITNLKALPEKSMSMCVTSPPYWGLRDYKTEPQDWGDWKGELGQEPDPDNYIEHLCLVFDEVWRVLADWGTLWVNIDDTYSGSGQGQLSAGIHNRKGVNVSEWYPTTNRPTLNMKDVCRKSLVGIPARFQLAMIQRGWICRNVIIWHKPNCMPESCTDRFTNDFEYFFLFSKQGNYYFDQQFEILQDTYNGKRGDIIHRNKTQSSMGTSTTIDGQIVHDIGKTKPIYDSKYRQAEIGQSAQSFIRVQKMNEERSQSRIKAIELFPNDVKAQQENINLVHDHGKTLEITYNDKTADEVGDTPTSGLRQKQKLQYTLRRNMRAVWEIPTEPHPEAHFACFPTKLIETPIKAGCPLYICEQCGLPKKHIYEKISVECAAIGGKKHEENKEGFEIYSGNTTHQVPTGKSHWEAQCSCNAKFLPGIVLDPFFGSGTTGVVANQLRRDFLGIELNPEYIQIANTKTDLLRKAKRMDGYLL